MGVNGLFGIPGISFHPLKDQPWYLLDKKMKLTKTNK